MERAGALHRQLEAGAHLAAQHLADFLVVFSGQVFPVYLHQHIANLQASLGSGHSFVRFRDDGTFQFVVPSNDRADTAIRVLYHLLQFALVFFRIILGIRVQRIKHGIDACADGFVGVEGIDIKHVQFLDDGVEYIQVLSHLETAVIPAFEAQTNGRNASDGQQGNHSMYLPYSFHLLR